MDRDEIDTAVAAALVAEQFPRWADLPLVAVEPGGWDNRTFRLGTDLVVRLPSAEGYASAVAKELTWLPRLAPTLPVPIPLPVAAGVPSARYPWPWSIRRWLPGRPATAVGDDEGFAAELAGFLVALWAVDARGGPAAGPHSFHRGADLRVYDDQTRHAIDTLAGRVPGGLALDVWETALASRWVGEPVWFHGDVAAGNLLVDDGHLTAVIDFGTCGVGDPACDLTIAWTLLDGPAREVFRAGVAAPDALWARARGWALWKALITAADAEDDAGSAASMETISRVVAEHRAG